MHPKDHAWPGGHAWLEGANFIFSASKGRSREDYSQTPLIRTSLLPAFSVLTENIQKKIWSLKNTFICMFQDDHILALMWTKIGGDLIWHMDEKAPLSSQNSDIYYDWRSLNETWRQFSLRLFSGLLSVNPWWKKNEWLACSLSAGNRKFFLKNFYHIWPYLNSVT